MRAKGLSWEPVKVDLFKAEQYDSKYLKLNPKGVVPTLVHDGKPVPRWLAPRRARPQGARCVAKQQGEYIARLLIKQAQREI